AGGVRRDRLVDGGRSGVFDEDAVGDAGRRLENLEVVRGDVGQERVHGELAEQIALTVAIERVPVLEDVNAAVGAAILVLDPELADQSRHCGKRRGDLVALPGVLRAVDALELEVHDQDMHDVPPQSVALPANRASVFSVCAPFSVQTAYVDSYIATPAYSPF